jgi:hypothetical protein
MKLNCFVDWLDVGKGEQFAALTVDTGDGALYLSFRGTDDSLAGWKEDFEMACMPEVPAQKKALEYTSVVAKQFPRKKLRLGGHSKGGNLAIYAGVFSPEKLQLRMTEIWSNDGPGFHMDLPNLPEYKRIEAKVHSIVPKSSVVGMLLEHVGEHNVVKSSNKGLLQHDAMSWEVLGPSFVTVNSVSGTSRMVNDILKNWLRETSNEERATFVDTLYRILETSQAKSIDDLNAEKGRIANVVLKEIGGLSKETKTMLGKTISVLFKEGNQIIKNNNNSNKAKKK